MKGNIDNSNFRRMLKPHSPTDRIAYLDYMVDFYFKVMIALGSIGFKSQFRAQMTSSLQTARPTTSTHTSICVMCSVASRIQPRISWSTWLLTGGSPNWLLPSIKSESKF